MVDLRPLILVTGTLRVEGGEQNRMHNENTTRSGNVMKVVVNRRVSKDRRAANVIVTDYMRQLRRIVILRTPYGALVDPANLDKLKTLLALVAHKIVDFNKDDKHTRIQNCVLHERLAGQRLTAISGWIAAEIAYGTEEVKEALPLLTQTLQATA